MKTKKFSLLISVLLIILIILIGLILYTLKEHETSPVVSVTIVPHLKENYLEWRVKNYDEKDSIVFSDGNIMNYSIRQISSNKTFSNDQSKDKDTIILKPQKVYSKKVVLDEIDEKGEYEATFWAVTKDDITYKTVCTFKVDTPK